MNPMVLKIGDDIMIVSSPDAYSVYVWNHWTDSPLKIATLGSSRVEAGYFKITNRWFPQCSQGKQFYKMILISLVNTIALKY